MRFPSLKYLSAQITTSFARFYMPLLFAMTGTLYAIMLAEGSSPAYVKILLTCALGLSLSLGSAVYAERSAKPVMKLVMPILSVVLAVAYWYWLAPDTTDEYMRPWLIYVVLLIVMHLWVATAPYLRAGERTGFWQYNEALYARMILSLLFSAALYAGLALALFACQELFKIHIRSNTYFKLWIFIAGIFNTWFFLAGIPGNYNELDTEKPFPRALKIFTQYILMPLVVLYMVILYTYGIKILVNWSLPRGWVSMLILCYAVAGILAILLVTPLRESKDNAWVRMFSRLFFIATLPLLGLLYIAIQTRISWYGITESRYFLLLIGAWLGVISLYFIFSRNKNIKVIPISLGIIGQLSLLGPWSAFSVSTSSQQGRMKRILYEARMLPEGGKISMPAAKVGTKTAEELRSIIEYFTERRNVAALQPFFTTDLKKISDSVDRDAKESGYTWTKKENMKRSIWALLSKTENEYYASSVQPYHMPYLHISHDAGINIQGYARLCEYEYQSYRTDRNDWIRMSKGDSMQVKLVPQDSFARLDFVVHDKVVSTIDLTGIIRAARRSSSDDPTPVEQMTLLSQGDVSVKMIVKSIDMNAIDSDLPVATLEAWILVK